MERGKKVRESASETPIFTGKLVYNGTVLNCKNRDTGNRRGLQSETLENIEKNVLKVFSFQTLHCYNLWDCYASVLKI